jgi:queuine tRNA-ribosyltransferase
MFKFETTEENARNGKIITKHGELTTPFFMPDATRGFVRSLSNEDIGKAGVGPMVVNTYHLYLKPGMENIKKSGGINKFMNWNYPLLSDSGGYQVFSLIHKNSKMGKITENEVIFKSPYDGSLHKLTPEKSIQIQFDLGVDMMVCLDDPPPNSYSKEKIEKAVKRTIRWAKRCKDEYLRQVEIRKLDESERPLIFGVIQGGKYLDLRKYCCEELKKIGFDGYGFGARHIDDDGKIMEEVVRETASYIPENSLRFALGVGTPEDIIKCFYSGWDMFDCVIPTREGRHGRLFIRKNTNSQIFPPQRDPAKAVENLKSKFYETININNEKYKNDFFKIDENCDCEMCQNYSKAYMRYLFSQKEPMAMRLASLHNLKFYMDLMKSLKS